VTVPAICNGNREYRMPTLHIKRGCESTSMILNILHLTSHCSYCQKACGPITVETKDFFFAESVFFKYVFRFYINH
jgi:hypothetical protein